jgi:RNA polymerase sigma-70 factor (ECF subfamily)
LYQATSAQLYGMLLIFLKDRELASEVLQEGYIKIWLHAGEFCLNRSAPMTWLTSVMRHQAIDELRKQAKHRREGEFAQELDQIADQAEGPLEQTCRGQEKQRARRCLECLKTTQRNAFLLAYFQEVSHEEIAIRLNRPLGTVKSWLRRGLARMKECHARTESRVAY